MPLDQITAFNPKSFVCFLFVFVFRIRICLEVWVEIDEQMRKDEAEQKKEKTNWKERIR